MFLFFVLCGYASIAFALATQLPQIYTMLLHKSGKNISYPYLIIILVDCLLYCLYGIGFILDKNYDGIPIIITGVIPFIITSILFFIKLTFGIQKYLKKKKSKNIKDATVESIEENDSENPPPQNHLTIASV